MINNSVLNVVISLVFIFLIYSLLATALHEAFANIFQSRANTLYKGIKQMLTNTNLNQNTFARISNFLRCKVIDLWLWLKSWVSDKEVKTLYNKFYHHPIIKNYGENAVFSKPAYLSPENFSIIIIDTIKNLNSDNEFLTADFKMIKNTLYQYSQEEPTKKTKRSVAKAISQIDKDALLLVLLRRFLFNIPTNQPKTPIALTSNVSTILIKVPEKERLIDCETYKILNFHLNQAAGDLDVFKHRLEKWFNDSMDRVSGWYKRHTQFILLIIGLLLAIILNIDTIAITSYLSKHNQEAEIIANMGAASISDYTLRPTTGPISQKNLKKIIVESDSINTLLGLGWGDYGQKDKKFINSIKKDKPGTVAEIFRFINDKSNFYDSLTNKNNIKVDTISNVLFNKYRFYISRQYVYCKIDWTKFLGFFITAIAISLGAPFWFDLLSKVVNLRSSGKPINPSGSTSKYKDSDNSQIDG